MTSIIQKKRLTNEVKILSQQPLHYCTAYPDESNPLIWYFIIIGQKGTDYHKGEYIGKIVHSPKYPAEPPDYYMLTPSGRYSIGSKICLTNSSYHKGDWSSTWNILSILIAFYSIWLDDKEHGISHITDTPKNRIKMADNSIEYNKNNNANIYAKFNRTHLCDDTPTNLIKKKEDTDNKEIVIKPEEIVIKPEEIIIKPEEIVIKLEEIVIKPEEIVIKLEEVKKTKKVNKIVIKPEEIVKLVEVKKTKKVNKIVMKPEEIVMKQEEIVMKQEEIVMKQEEEVKKTKKVNKINIKNINEEEHDKLNNIIVKQDDDIMNLHKKVNKKKHNLL